MGSPIEAQVLRRHETDLPERRLANVRLGDLYVQVDSQTSTCSVRRRCARSVDASSYAVRVALKCWMRCVVRRPEVSPIGSLPFVAAVI